MPGAWTVFCIISAGFGGVAHYSHGKLLWYTMATKKKVYAVSTKLHVVVVAEKASKEAPARQFGVVPHRIHGRSVMVVASDNFRVARIVRLLWATMLPTALYNKQEGLTTAEIRVLIFSVC